LFGLGKLRKVKTASLLLVSDNVTESAPIVGAETLREYTAKAGKVVFEGLNRLQV